MQTITATSCHLVTVLTKFTDNERWSRCGGKGTLLRCCWGWKPLRAAVQNITQLLSEPRTKPAYEPQSHSRAYTGKTILQKDACSPACTAAPCTIAMAWKKHKFPSTDECTLKMDCICKGLHRSDVGIKPFTILDKQNSGKDLLDRTRNSTQHHVISYMRTLSNKGQARVSV